MTNKIADELKIGAVATLSGFVAQGMTGSKLMGAVSYLATGVFMSIPLFRRAEYEATLKNDPERVRHIELAEIQNPAVLDNEILQAVKDGREILKESWFIEYAEKGELANPKEIERKELPLEQMIAILFLTHYGVAKKNPAALFGAFLLTLNVKRVLDRDFSITKNETLPLMPKSRGFTVGNLQELEKKKITRAAKEDVYNKAIIALTKNGFDVRKESWFNNFNQGKMDWQKIAVSSKTVGANTALNFLKLHQSDLDEIIKI